MSVGAADPPAAAGVVFGNRLPLAQRFHRALATTAVERGLIGPREVPRLWDRHVLNCAVVGEVIPDAARVADVGSGAGLPGLALAIARPDLHVTLIEPLQRRVVWLEETVAELGLGESVTVLRARAEDCSASDFEVVTSRAVAALDVLAGWCLPLLRPDGVMVAVKGASAQQEVEQAGQRLTALGAREWSVEYCGKDLLEMPTTVVTVRLGDRVVRRGQVGRGAHHGQREGRRSKAAHRRRGIG